MRFSSGQGRSKQYPMFFFLILCTVDVVLPFLRNGGSNLQSYTTSHPARQ